MAGGTCICTGAPVVDWPSTSAGHVSTSGGMSGTVGLVGVLGVSSPHDTVTSATAKVHNHPLRERRPIREAGLARDNRPIIPSAAERAEASQRTANSKQPGVTSSRPGAAKNRLAGETTPAAWNCTVRTFSPSPSKT